MENPKGNLFLRFNQPTLITVINIFYFSKATSCTESKFWVDKFGKASTCIYIMIVIRLIHYKAFSALKAM